MSCMQPIPCLHSREYRSLSTRQIALSAHYFDTGCKVEINKARFALQPRDELWKIEILFIRPVEAHAYYRSYSLQADPYRYDTWEVPKATYLHMQAGCLGARGSSIYVA